MNYHKPRDQKTQYLSSPRILYHSPVVGDVYRIYMGGLMVTDVLYESNYLAF